MEESACVYKQGHTWPHGRHSWGPQWTGLYCGALETYNAKVVCLSAVCLCLPLTPLSRYGPMKQPDCPGTHSIDHSSLELPDLLVSVFSYYSFCSSGRPRTWHVHRLDLNLRWLSPCPSECWDSGKSLQLRQVLRYIKQSEFKET